MKLSFAGAAFGAAALLAVVAQADDRPARAYALEETDLARLAAPFAALYRDVEAFETASFSSPDEVVDGLYTVARLSAEDLALSWTAYAALSAAITPDFIAGVRDAAALYGEDALTEGLRRDPRYARSLPGGGEAVRVVVRTLAEDAETFRTAAARVNAQSYAVQDDAWALSRHPSPDARLAVLNAAAADIRPADPQTTAWLSEHAADRAEQAGEERFRPFRIAFAGAGGRKGDTPRRTAVADIDGALTLAALSMLGDADATDATLYRARQVDRCATMARLNVEQCVAAAAFPFEDVYCIGEHGLAEIAACIDPGE